MSESPFASGAAFLADFEKAVAEARAEHKRLATEVAALRQEQAQLTASIDAAKQELCRLQHMSGVEFIGRCVEVGIDKHTMDELKAKIG